SHYQCPAGRSACAPVSMPGVGVEVDRVSRFQQIVIRTNAQPQGPSEYVDELDPKMGMERRRLSIFGTEFSNIPHHLPVAGFLDQVFEIVGGGIGDFRHSQALTLSGDIDKMLLLFVGEEVIEAHTKYKGNAQESGKGWYQLASFQF